MKDVDSGLTAEYLRLLFKYDKKTGHFYKLSSGKKCGHVNLDGYVCIVIDKKTFRAHRLAWLYVHGVWPKELVDHDNRKRADNRFLNLREATRSENTQNSDLSRAAIGLKGVSRSGKKWRAAIALHGKDFYLGTFNSPEEAHMAYIAAAKIHHTRNPYANCKVSKIVGAMA